MIARRLLSLEVAIGIAIARVDAGGPGPGLDTLLAWHRLLAETKDIANEVEAALIGIPPVPAAARPLPGTKPRLSVIQGGAA